MKENAYFYRLIRGIFKPLFLIVYRPEIIGRENIPECGRVVIAGNHKHALDPILVDISTKRIVRTLAKKELHDGAFGFVFRGVKTIPVDLHSSSNREALYEAVYALENEYAVNVSPEAKRNYTNELLLPFKYGAVSMAEKASAPIVPYAITGDYKLFSSDLKIKFGKPFYIQKELSAANEELYNRIADLLRDTADSKALSDKKFTSFREWERQKEQKTRS